MFYTSGLYCRDDIFYPTMKALAWQMGTEEEFEGLTLRLQVVLPPKGASEIEIRVRQVRIWHICVGLQHHISKTPIQKGLHFKLVHHSFRKLWKALKVT